MSQLTKQALQSENQTNFPNNNTGYITPSLLRSFNSDMIDSLALQSEVDSISSSVAALTADSGAWATTGSNTFNGNQTINGNLYVSHSNSINVGSTFQIIDTNTGITLIDSQAGVQLRNFNGGELQIDQNANGDITLTNHTQDIHLTTPSGAVFINDVDFEQYSASVDSRLNNAQGVQGATGAQGTTGTQGATGQSIQGSQGTQGVGGAQGGIGPQGTTGIQGQTGLQGIQGRIGAQGTTGVGAQGTQGATGGNGSTGAQGSQGATGNDGGVGSQGAQGIGGTQGAQGGFGAQGETGAGTQGAQGFTGTGVQGVQGVQGIAGGGGTVNTGSFITTGSAGLEQSITGSLGINTLNNVLAINTTYTASTAATPNEGTGSSVFFVNYNNVPNSNPSIFNIDNSGNWSVSGSGANNLVVTNVYGDDNGIYVEATGATFVNGANYTFKAQSYLNTLNFNNGITQIQGDSGNNSTIQVGNNAGDGPYPGFRTVVNSTTNAGNIYSFYAIDDAAGSGLSFGFSLNTYTQFGPGLVGVIYGGGNYNGSSDSIAFVSSSIRMLKPTTFNAPVTFTTDLSLNGAITASKILLTNAGTTAIQYRQPSTGSVNGVNATFYGKDTLQVFQYQGQPYAFCVNLSANQLNAYTGSEFQWGLLTNGTNSLPGGGTTWFSMCSGSTISGSGPGANKVGLDYLGTAMIMDFRADTAFNRKVYVDKGMYVSASAGGPNVVALTVNGTNAGYKAIQVTGSVDIGGASGQFTNNLSASFTAPTDFGNTVRVTNNGQLKLLSGTNQQTGIATLNGGNPGTVTVSNSLVTTSSLIFLTKQSNGTPGAVAISSKGTGTFTITSTDNGDTDTVAWFIVNPS